VADEELKRLLDQNLELSRENNKILKRMHRAQRSANLLHILYRLITLALLLAALYFAYPYIQKMMRIYDSVQGLQDSFQNSSFGSMFNQNTPQQ